MFKRGFRLFCALLLLPGFSVPALAATAPEYTIAQLFASAKRSPEVRFARTFADHAVITTPSWRMAPDRVRYFYDHPNWGTRIRELLKNDPIVRFEDVDRFLARNFGRLRRASFYREGFVTLQLAEPEYVLIVPVSLVTVRQAEAEIEQVLKLHPDLFN